jgi:hypothetical protein
MMIDQVSDFEAFLGFQEASFRLSSHFSNANALTSLLGLYKITFVPLICPLSVLVRAFSLVFFSKSLFFLNFFPYFPFSNFFSFLKMPKDGNDSDGLGEAHPALWEAHLTNADEGQIRIECFIPKYIKI